MSKIPPTLCLDFTLKWCDTDPNMFSNSCKLIIYQTSEIKLIHFDQMQIAETCLRMN